MKHRKRILLIVITVLLLNMVGISTNAASKDVTIKYRTKVEKLINPFMPYLVRGCFTKSFSFNDYSRTNMVLLNKYSIYTQTDVYSKAKSQIAKLLKKYFNSSKVNIKSLSKYPYRTLNDPNELFRLSGGKIKYCAGDLGENIPGGTITKITRKSSTRYIVNVSAYIDFEGNYPVITRDKAGEFSIELRTTKKNDTGFYIYKIKRTKVYQVPDLYQGATKICKASYSTYTVTSSASTNSATPTKNSSMAISDSTSTKTWGPWQISYSFVAPSTDVEVESYTEYRYKDKQTTTSTASSLSGWNYNYSSTSYGSYGSYSSWGIDRVTGSDTRQVDTATVYYYCYNLCPYCGAHMHVSTGCYTWAGGCGRTNIGNHWVTMYSTTSYSNTYEFHGTGHYAIDTLPGGRWFKVMSTNPTPCTGYRYRDRSKSTTYYFYRWTDWSSWSTTPYYSSSTRTIDTRTVYKYRVRS